MYVEKVVCFVGFSPQAVTSRGHLQVVARARRPATGAARFLDSTSQVEKLSAWSVLPTSARR